MATTTSTMATTRIDDDGPLRLPPPPAARESFDTPLPAGMSEAAVAARRQVLRQRKAAAGTQAQLGAATSARWLPEGLGPELDEVREQHLAARARVADALAKLNDLDAKFATEDQARKAAYAEAARTGEDPAEVPRTSEADRQELREAVEAVLWEHVAAFTKIIDVAKATLQAHESKYLASLGDTRELDKAVAEAERQLEDARRKRWRNTAVAAWLKNENEGGGPGGAWGPQPAPDGTQVAPDQFDGPPPGAFTRRYYEQERRARVDAEPVVVDDPLGTSVLDDGEAVDVIEPLDEATRFGAKA